MIDLTPACSSQWRPLSRVANTQMSALMKMQRGIADRDEIVQWMRSLPQMPESVEQLRKTVADDVSEHNDLYHSDRIEWRRSF